jgi:hypothetical protein
MAFPRFFRVTKEKSDWKKPENVIAFLGLIVAIIGLTIALVSKIDSDQTSQAASTLQEQLNSILNSTLAQANELSERSLAVAEAEQNLQNTLYNFPLRVVVNNSSSTLVINTGSRFPLNGNMSLMRAQLNGKGTLVGNFTLLSPFDGILNVSLNRLEYPIDYPPILPSIELTGFVKSFEITKNQPYPLNLDVLFSTNTTLDNDDWNYFTSLTKGHTGYSELTNSVSAFFDMRVVLNFVMYEIQPDVTVTKQIILPLSAVISLHDPWR